MNDNEIKHINIVVEDFLKTGLSSKQPQYVIVCGPVGTGKSRMRKQKYSKDYVFIDAGDIYLKLTDNETKKVDKIDQYVEITAKSLVSRAIEQKKNIVIEIIMDKEQPIKSIMDKMIEKGYKVQVDYIHNDPVKSWENNLNRGKHNISAYYSQDQTMSWFVNYFNNKKE